MNLKALESIPLTNQTKLVSVLNAGGKKVWLILSERKRPRKLGRAIAPTVATIKINDQRYGRFDRGLSAIDEEIERNINGVFAETYFDGDYSSFQTMIRLMTLPTKSPVAKLTARQIEGEWTYLGCVSRWD